MTDLHSVPADSVCEGAGTYRYNLVFTSILLGQEHYAEKREKEMKDSCETMQLRKEG